MSSLLLKKTSIGSVVIEILNFRQKDIILYIIGYCWLYCKFHVGVNMNANFLNSYFDLLSFSQYHVLSILSYQISLVNFD